MAMRRSFSERPDRCPRGKYPRRSVRAWKTDNGRTGAPHSCKRHSGRIIVVVSTTTAMTVTEEPSFCATRASSRVKRAVREKETADKYVRECVVTGRSNLLSVCMSESPSPIHMAIERNDRRGGARNPDAFTQGSIQYDATSLHNPPFQRLAKTNFEAGRTKFRTLRDAEFFKKRKEKE